MEKDENKDIGFISLNRDLDDSKSRFIKLRFSLNRNLESKDENKDLNY